MLAIDSQKKKDQVGGVTFDCYPETKESSDNRY